MTVIGTGDFQVGKDNRLEEVVNVGGNNYVIEHMKLSEDSELVPSDYYARLGASGTSGVDFMSKFGYNSSVGTSEEPVWAESAIAYTYPATGTPMTLSSSNANDNSVGTGVRTVYIEGLLSDGTVASETKETNGQTGTALSNNYWRVYRAQIVTAGSGNTNAGIIYIGYGAITAGKPATIQASIAAGFGQTLQALYTIPVGKTGLLLDSLSAAFDKAGEVRIYTRLYGGLFRIFRRFPTVAGMNHLKLGIPHRLPARTDIEVRALVGTGTGAVGASFDIELS